MHYVYILLFDFISCLPNAFRVDGLPTFDEELLNHYKFKIISQFKGFFSAEYINKCILMHIHLSQTRKLFTVVDLALNFRGGAKTFVNLGGGRGGGEIPWKPTRIFRG